jgi:hypothetical protein
MKNLESFLFLNLHFRLLVKESPKEDDVLLILDMTKMLKLAMGDINQVYLQNEYSFFLHSFLDSLKYNEKMFESNVISSEGNI